MITAKYLQCLKDLQNNSNIELGELSEINNYDCEPPSERFTQRRKRDLEEANIAITDKDLEYFNFSSIVLNWDSSLRLGNETVLRAGFVFNGITDALTHPTDDFEDAVNLKGDGDYSQRMGWFERLPAGVDDSVRGCFIQQEGVFPPPIAFFHRNWYVKLDFDYHKYIELVFENYGFKGWQYFYIDIVKEIPRLEEVLEDMRIAVKTLPLLFPDKDWSYHQKKYDKTLQKLGKIIDKQNFQDIPSPSIQKDFDAERPTVLIFYLKEFEQTFGKLEGNISEAFYNCPFFIYDKSLKKPGITFENEKEISADDCTVGFTILRRIWENHISKSSLLLFSSLFKKIVNQDKNTYSVEPTYGFVPGYDLSTAIETARKHNFLVVRWEEYWNGMSDKYKNNLPDDLNQKRRDLTDQGSRFQMGHKNLKAADCYIKAYELLPEPKDQWNCTSVVLRGIAENYYLKAFFDSKSEDESRKYYLLSLQYFEEYMKDPDSIGAAVNHSKIGRIWYELGDFENAKEELMRAYMAEGKEWFDDLDLKYYELIRPMVEKS
jgi:hypothetical protein